MDYEDMDRILSQLREDKPELFRLWIKAWINKEKKEKKEKNDSRRI